MLDAEFKFESNGTIFKRGCREKRGFYNKNTSKEPSKSVFRWKPIFYPITSSKNSTIRFRIKFCIHHNRLERQYKSSGKSGPELSNRVPTSFTFQTPFSINRFYNWCCFKEMEKLYRNEKQQYSKENWKSPSKFKSRSRLLMKWWNETKKLDQCGIEYHMTCK